MDNIKIIDTHEDEMIETNSTFKNLNSKSQEQLLKNHTIDQEMSHT